MSLKSLLALISVVIFFGAGLASAQVQDENARVTVPDVRGGARVAGCYTADRALYGPYTLTLCLKRSGAYAVRGNRLKCDGALSWRTGGRDVSINLRRASCNRGVAWAEANIVCRAGSKSDILLDQLLNQRDRSADKLVVIPDNPSMRRLSCTYRPTVRGQRATNFFAYRQDR